MINHNENKDGNEKEITLNRSIHKKMLEMDTNIANIKSVLI